MWNPNSTALNCIQDEEDDSWEVKAFAEDTGNAMGTTWPPRSYTCTFCRREFRSAQALGGHMNVHRRDRARLHQVQPNFKNPNNPTSTSSSSSSTFLIPSQELVANGCLFYSLPNPDYAIFNPSSLNNNMNVNGNHSNFQSITPHPNLGNFMNFPSSIAHRSFNSSLSNSSNNVEVSTSRNRNLDNKRKENDLVIEGIDLELRLGCNSKAS